MSATSFNPLRCSFFEADFRRPELFCYRQMRRLSLCLAALNRIADNAETIAEVRNRHIDAIAISAREYETGRVFLIADIQRMNLNTRFIAGNTRSTCAKAMRLSSSM